MSKEKCTAEEGCAEDIFRDGLCFDHFIEVKDQEWNDHLDDIRADYQYAILPQGEPALDGSWWGYSAEEACR